MLRIEPYLRISSCITVGRDNSQDYFTQLKEPVVRLRYIELSLKFLFEYQTRYYFVIKYFKLPVSLDYIII